MNEYLDKLLNLLDVDKYGIVKIFSIVFAALLLDFIQKRVLKKLYQRLQSTRTQWDDALVHALQKPLTILIWIIGLSLALDVMEISVGNEMRVVGVIATITWVLVRFISYAEENILHQHKVAGKSFDRTTASAISQLLRTTILITSTLVMLQSLGFNISAILAFGGIGGIAIGFAAKDLLANFFGGMMIYLDRPFAIGDWVRSTDRDIEGTVEKIGWRTTMIRTFDKRPLYVPNSIFSTISVENPSRMSHRRIYETIGIRYDDISVMAKIIMDVKAMLVAHPEIDQTQTMIVNFNSFASSSLDFFIYTFTRTTDWIKYHEVKQDVLLKLSEVIDKHGAEMAFPTSTLHIPDEVKFNEFPVK
ncbi:Small-conductance mechanosensitive channel [hydrothermal vent metagenome]|uniref:Small-conductance mechanosensitive channel n=1 Tax=hydrothermal vent metagenome TaxID=652676 RepID=A0A3B1ATI0_9ZZZZ